MPAPSDASVPISISTAQFRALTRRSGIERRIRDIVHVRDGETFTLFRAHHVTTDVDVLLTVARPGDHSAIAQLGVIRKALTEIGDRRVGLVVDRFWGEQGSGAPWGCLASTWHPNGVGLHNAIMRTASAEVMRYGVIDLVLSMLEQVALLHSAGYTHCDIAPQNFIVDATGQVHLVDFETLTPASAGPGARTVYTPEYSHPDKVAGLLAEDVTHDKRARWDLYAVGRLILKVLEAADPFEHVELSRYMQRALRLIACLCLDGRNTPVDGALGLRPGFFAENAFSSVDGVIDAVRRVAGLSNPIEDVPELGVPTGSVVEIRTQAPVPFTPRVKALVETKRMQSLGTFMQLGLINFIWPTATHTRLEHSIGTFGVACSAVSRLYSDPVNPLFRVMATPGIARVVIAAALLHDIGHYPLAHDLEEAYPGLFEHEDRSVRWICEGKVSEILKDGGPAGWAIRAEDVASVISGVPIEGSVLSPSVCGMLHSIISGSIDVDKLDYLVRDSAALGVAAGAGIDSERVISSLTILATPRALDDPDTLVPRLAVRAKGLRSAELVGRVRSHMFGVAYWHHSYRAIKAMLHWIVWTSMEQGGGSPGRGKGSTGFAPENTAKHLFRELERRFVVEDELVDFSRHRQFDRIADREGFVLDSLVRAGNGTCEYMLDLLDGRRWFKPVLTVEHPRNLSSPWVDHLGAVTSLWDLTSALFETRHSTRTRSAAQMQLYAKRRLALARLIQSSVVEAILNVAPGRFSKFFDAKSQIGQLVESARKSQVFLFDSVDPTKAEQKPLYFARREGSDPQIVDGSLPIDFGRSYDERMLSEEFLPSNGAIRLLCSPAHAGLVVNALTGPELLDIVVASLAKVLAEVTG